MTRTDAVTKCECGNMCDAGETQCDHCAWVATQPPHKGHWSAFGGYWCDTCDSPYCELA